MYERILVTLDGSELAEEVLPHAEALAEKFNSTLTLFAATVPTEGFARPVVSSYHFLTSPQMTADFAELAAAERQAAVEYLGKVAQRFEALDITVTQEIAQGSPAAGIVAAARSLNADLIAMATHGRGGLGRLLLGSVADEVLRTATCPVLLVRAGTQQMVGTLETSNPQIAGQDRIESGGESSAESGQ